MNTHPPSHTDVLTQTHALANAKRMQIYSEKPTDHSTSPLHKHDHVKLMTLEERKHQTDSLMIFPSMTEHTVLNTSYDSIKHPGASSELEIREVW